MFAKLVSFPNKANLIGSKRKTEESNDGMPDKVELFQFNVLNCFNL